MNSLGFRCGLVAVVTCLVSGAFQPARACSLVHYADNGRYVGGDLVTQIAVKTDLIQLVRVTEKRIVTRTYSLGSWYLQFGNTDVPEHEPEYVDRLVFTLEAVDTLKGTLDEKPWLLEATPRVEGYDFSVFASGDHPTAPDGDGLHPNRLPEWVFSRPADDGYAFIGASQDAGLGSGECFSPYFLEVGQVFIALRRSDGRLYPPNGGFPLEIDVELVPEHGNRRRESLNMQSLIPVSGPDDPFVRDLQQRLAALER